MSEELEKIVAAVAQEYETSPALIMSRTWASSPEGRARQVAMFLYHQRHPQPGYETVLAAYFGRHASTVFYNIRNIRKLMSNPKVSKRVNRAKRRI